MRMILNTAQVRRINAARDLMALTSANSKIFSDVELDVSLLKSNVTLIKFNVLLLLFNVSLLMFMVKLSDM